MRIVEPYVLIKEDPKIDHVGSIIIIDSKNLNAAKMGTVHMIGDKKENYRVKEGERIAFNKVAGTPIEIDGVGYLHMRETDITVIFS
jgi:co-chaperonin GroES (HSP10)|tara:strand:+ start:7254 stop:7514 length:261 start_codon:yes stop_codon:yes gene_type:complete